MDRRLRGEHDQKAASPYTSPADSNCERKSSSFVLKDRLPQNTLVGSTLASDADDSSDMVKDSS